MFYDSENEGFSASLCNHNKYVIVGRQIRYKANIVTVCSFTDARPTETTYLETNDALRRLV
jgi:hypothetical protein